METLKKGICTWAKINLFWLVCMLIIRVLFYFEVHTRIEIDASQFAGIMKGSLYDFYLMCHLMTWLTIPFLALYRFFPKTTGKIFMGLVFFYVVVAALLTEYYCNLSMPLDHVILVYTPEEVMGTATSSANVTAEPFLWFFGTIILVVLLSLLWRKVKTGFLFSAVMLLLAIVICCSVRYKKLVRSEKYYKDHASFCLAVNQPSYSFIKIVDHLRDVKMGFGEDDEPTPEVIKASLRHQSLYPDFSYRDPAYPFFRAADDPDMLGSFVDNTDDGLPPNFVFIIVESLGQKLTGVDDPTVSFTPFLDSLKRESLYWTNCLSTSERTFGVLPSIFASAPYGKYGFCVTDKPMPNHKSLLRDLKDNGYGTSYYYGGVHSFDRFDGFLKANKMDFIYVPDMQNTNSENYQYLNEFHRWGLDDRETFRYVMQRKTEQPSSRPNIDIIMTLTTHEPFFFDDEKAYEKRVEDMVAQHPEMTEKERTNITKNLNIFSCFLYVDDCIRELLAFYRTLPEYRNTIFVITGDHRMGPLNFGSPLTKYNVPLLLYSPLIRQPREMHAVVSHLDITPTLNAYLAANYDYRISSDCHWMGTSLDTLVAYRNTRKQAFMLNNRDVVDYVNGDYVLTNNRLFILGEDLSWEPSDDDAKLASMQAELADFNTVSRYAVHKNHLNLLKGAPEFLIMSESEQQYHITPSDQYGTFFDAYEFTDSYDDVFVDIAFDLQSQDTTKALPLLVVELGKYYMALRLRSSDEVSLNTGNEECFRYLLSIPLQEDSQGKVLKMYLNNVERSTMDYGNIKVRVSGMRKP